MTDPLPPLASGSVFPDFALETADGRIVTKAGLAGRQAVLFFYPRDDTPGCTAEAIAFSNARPEFEAAGVALLGISKDSAARHRAFAAKHGLAVDLATDTEPGLSDMLGIWTEKRNYGRTYLGMVRTTYFLAADGTVLRVWPKVRVKGHVDEVLSAVQNART